MLLRRIAPPGRRATSRPMVECAAPKPVHALLIALDSSFAHLGADCTGSALSFLSPAGGHGDGPDGPASSAGAAVEPDSLTERAPEGSDGYNVMNSFLLGPRVDSKPAPSSKALSSPTALACDENRIWEESCKETFAANCGPGKGGSDVTEPFATSLKWELNGKLVASPSALGVQEVLAQTSPSVIYVAGSNATMSTLPWRTAAYLFVVSFSISILDAAKRPPVYLVFSETEIEQNIIRNWASTVQAKGVLRGFSAEIVLGAYVSCRKALGGGCRLGLAEMAGRGGVCTSRGPNVQGDEATLEVPPRASTVSNTRPGATPLQVQDPLQDQWSDTLRVGDCEFSALKLVGSLSKDLSLRGKPALLKYFTSSGFTLERTSRMEHCLELALSVARGEGKLHASALFCSAWAASGTSALLEIGACKVLCTWIRATRPLSEAPSWMCRAIVVPPEAVANGSWLDVSSYRRYDLGLVGRSHISGPPKLLSQLPRVGVARDKGGKSSLRLVPSSENIDNEEESRRVLGAVQVLSRGRVMASAKRAKAKITPNKSNDSEAHNTTLLEGRPGNFRVSEASALERKVLAQMDEETDRRRKEYMNGIDDALFNEPLAGKSLRQRTTSRNRDKCDGDDPAAVALRGRRSLYAKGAMNGVTPAGGTPTPAGSARQTPTVRPASTKRRSASATAPSTRKRVRSTPMSSALLSTRSGAGRTSTPMSNHCNTSEPLSQPMSLSCFLSGLQSLKESVPKSGAVPKERLNGFSLGASPAVLGWRELGERLENSGLMSIPPSIGPSPQNAPIIRHGIEECKGALSRHNGTQTTSPEKADIAVQSFEKCLADAQMDHGSAVQEISASPQNVAKLQAAAKICGAEAPSQEIAPTQASGCGTEIEMSQEEIAFCLATYVTSNPKRFSPDQQLWLPNLLQRNCKEFHLPSHVLLDPVLPPSVIALRLLKGRGAHGGGEGEIDGLFYTFNRWVCERRQNPNLLAEDFGKKNTS